VAKPFCPQYFIGLSKLGSFQRPMSPSSGPAWEQKSLERLTLHQIVRLPEHMALSAFISPEVCGAWIAPLIIQISGQEVNLMHFDFFFFLFSVSLCDCM